MSGAASVEAGEQLRLFCALRLPAAVLDALTAWQARAFAAEPRARVVGRDHLHATLAFLGRQPRDEIPAIADELRAAAEGATVPRLTVRGYRETRTVGMLVCDDEGAAAGRLARDLHERLERLGVYERERREWLPHVTVVRFRERLRLSPPLPELEPFVTSDAAVYMSVLRPSGAQYSILESVAIGR